MTDRTSNPLALATAMTENSGGGSIPMLKIMFRTTDEMSAAADQIRALAKSPDETSGRIDAHKLIQELQRRFSQCAPLSDIEIAWEQGWSHDVEQVEAAIAAAMRSVEPRETTPVRMHLNAHTLTEIADKLNTAEDLTDCDRGCAADALRELVSIRASEEPTAPRPKATIEGLERLLQAEDSTPVEILPDGSVRPMTPENGNG